MRLWCETATSNGGVVRVHLRWQPERWLKNSSPNPPTLVLRQPRVQTGGGGAGGAAIGTWMGLAIN
jgi:hypothetical protein